MNSRATAQTADRDGASFWLDRADPRPLERRPGRGRPASPRHRAALTGSSLAHLAVLGLLLWFGAPGLPNGPDPEAEPFEMVFEPAQAPAPSRERPAVPFAPEALPPEALAPAEPAAPPPIEPVPDNAPTPPPPAAEALPPPPTPAPTVAEPPPAPVPLPSAKRTVAPQPTAPKPASRPKPAAERPTPATTAPPPSRDPAPPLAAPPDAAAAPQAVAAAAISPAWRRAVGAWLLDHKRYPDAARRRGESGTVGVSFAVARNGQVGDVTVTSSSGSSILDDAVLATLNGRQVPPFPSDMPQPQVRIAVRVVYSLEP